MATNMLKSLLLQTAKWPDEDQLELADYARVIAARRTGLYRVTNAERASLAEAMIQADHGEFVSEAFVSAADKHHDL